MHGQDGHQVCGISARAHRSYTSEQVEPLHGQPGARLRRVSKHQYGSSAGIVTRVPDDVGAQQAVGRTGNCQIADGQPVHRCRPCCRRLLLVGAFPSVEAHQVMHAVPRAAGNTRDGELIQQVLVDQLA